MHFSQNGRHEQTTSSMFIEQQAPTQFHRVSSESQVGEDEDEDDFTQTYYGEDSHPDIAIQNQLMNKADNKYSQKRLEKDEPTKQEPSSFDEQNARFKAYVREQWSRTSQDSRGQPQVVTLHPHSNETSERTNTQVDYQNVQLMPQLKQGGVGGPGAQRYANAALLSQTLNSNHVINATGTSNSINFSQTVNELSAILPQPKHHPTPPQRISLPKNRGAPLRGPPQVGTTAPNPNMPAIQVYSSNDYVTSSIEETIHQNNTTSFANEPDNTMILDDFNVDEATKLQSSFARRQASLFSNHQQVPMHQHQRPITTFNPFRSKSTPPLPHHSHSQSRDATNSSGQPAVSAEDAIKRMQRQRELVQQSMATGSHKNSTSFDQHETSDFALRKTSSGMLLQGHQTRQIEELEKVIAEKMGMIKQIDTMIQQNQEKKRRQGSNQQQERRRAMSTPQMPAPKARASQKSLNSQQHQSISPAKSRSQSLEKQSREQSRVEAGTEHQTITLKNNNNGRDPSRQRSNKSGRARELQQSKINVLVKKKNRYKAKLISLRQHAHMQDQQIQRLSQNLTGIESQACTVRNEHEKLQQELIKVQKDFARQSEEMTTQQAELQTSEQLISQLKMQLNQRADALLEIKREHTDMQIDNRRMQADIQDKDRELDLMKADFDRILQENKAYQLKFKEQEDALAQLKRVNQETQDEFNTFKNDIETKNDLITQLREQIVEASQSREKEEQQAIRKGEIEQLKDLLNDVMQSKGLLGGKKFGKVVAMANNPPTFSADEEDCADGDRESRDQCTDAEDEYESRPAGGFIHQGFAPERRKGGHQRVFSCATQTDDCATTSMDMDKCSCCQINITDEHSSSQVHLNRDYGVKQASFCQNCNFEIKSPDSNNNRKRLGRHQRIPLERVHAQQRDQKRTIDSSQCHEQVQCYNNGNGAMSRHANPYKRRSSSAQSPNTPHSDNSCCNSASRSPPPVKTLHGTNKRGQHSKGPVPVDNQTMAQLGQLQAMREVDLRRISELEVFCTELVKQVEHWRRLDKQGSLIHQRIEEQLFLVKNQSNPNLVQHVQPSPQVSYSGREKRIAPLAVAHDGRASEIEISQTQKLFV